MTHETVIASLRPRQDPEQVFHQIQQKWPTEWTPSETGW